MGNGDGNGKAAWITVERIAWVVLSAAMVWVGSTINSNEARIDALERWRVGAEHRMTVGGWSRDQQDAYADRMAQRHEELKAWCSAKLDKHAGDTSHPKRWVVDKLNDLEQRMRAQERRP